MSFTESLEGIISRNSNGLLSTHPTWGRVPLGLVFAVENGFPFESRHFNSSGEGMPLLRIRDVVRGSTETHYSGKFDRRFVVNQGDIVVGMDGDFKCRAWRGVPALLNQRVCRLTPLGDAYSTALLPHVLQGYLDAINAKTSAITVKHLSSRTIEDLPLPLPPREEQGRIVEAIESYLTRIDDAVASLERAQAKLKVYRASVLKAAVEGRLVPTEASLARAEKRAYEPAEALLARTVNERRRRWKEADLTKHIRAGMTPTHDKRKAKYKEPVAPDTNALPPLPEGWCWATTDQIFWFVTSGSRGWARYYSESGAAFIRISNLDHDSISLDLSEIQHVSPPPGSEGTRTRVAPGDVLISITADVGMIALVRDNLEEGYINQHISLARPVNEIWIPYLAWFLAARDGGQKQLLALQRGATKVGLGLDDIRSVIVPMPPLREQRRIVDEVERCFSLAADSEAAVSTNERRLRRLRQAVLKWAFEGKLVDQDPADKSADNLLARIRTERAVIAPRKTTGRRTKGAV